MDCWRVSKSILVELAKFGGRRQKPNMHFCIVAFLKDGCCGDDGASFPAQLCPRWLAFLRVSLSARAFSNLSFGLSARNPHVLLLCVAPRPVDFAEATPEAKIVVPVIHSLVRKASDCRSAQASDGPCFDSGRPDSQTRSLKANPAKRATLMQQ